MKAVVLWIVIIMTGAVLGWTRHSQSLELRRQNAGLRQSIVELSSYQRQTAQFQANSVDTNELKKLRAAWLELMKMRAEISRLRVAAKLDLSIAQEQVAELHTQTAQLENRAASLLEERADAQYSKLTHETLRSLVSSIRHMAKFNGGQLPRSFAEVQVALKFAPEHERQWLGHGLAQTNQLNPREAELLGRSFNVSARDYEFLPLNQPVSIGDPAVLFMRETKPRRLADGKYARQYAFTSGEVQEAISSDGNFSGWEADPPRKRPR